MFQQKRFLRIKEVWCLDEIIAKIRYATTELNKLVVKDRIASEEVLNFCTELEVRVINRKIISTILLPEMTVTGLGII